MCTWSMRPTESTIRPDRCLKTNKMKKRGNVTAVAAVVSIIMTVFPFLDHARNIWLALEIIKLIIKPMIMSCIDTLTHTHTEKLTCNVLNYV